MTTTVDRNLRQDVTYWAPAADGGTNDFGQPNTDNGVLLKGRWEDKVQQVRTQSGEEITSMATVYVNQDVAVNGFLKLGDFSGQPLNSDAREIVSYQTIPDLRNLSTERRAYL